MTEAWGQSLRININLATDMKLDRAAISKYTPG